MEVLGIATDAKAAAAAAEMAAQKSDEAEAPNRRLRLRLRPDRGGQAKARRAPKFSLSPMEIDRFVWKDVSVMLNDRAVTPENHIGISQAGFTLSNFVVDPRAAQPREAVFDGFLMAPGLAEKVTARGFISPRGDGLKAEWSVHGEGLSDTALAPYMAKGTGDRAQGIGHNGTFDANFAVNLATTADVLRAAFAIEEAKFEAGPQRGSLDSLDAMWTLRGGGDQGGHLTVSGVNYRKTAPAAQAAQVHLDRAVVAVSRLEASKAIDIDTIETAGLFVSSAYDSGGAKPAGADEAPEAAGPQTQSSANKTLTRLYRAAQIPDREYPQRGSAGGGHLLARCGPSRGGAAGAARPAPPQSRAHRLFRAAA